MQPQEYVAWLVLVFCCATRVVARSQAAIALPERQRCAGAQRYFTWIRPVVSLRSGELGKHVMGPDGSLCCLCTHTTTVCRPLLPVRALTLPACLGYSTQMATEEANASVPPSRPPRPRATPPPRHRPKGTSRKMNQQRRSWTERVPPVLRLPQRSQSKRQTSRSLRTWLAVDAPSYRGCSC